MVNKHPKSGVKWGLQNYFDQLVLSPFVLNCPVQDVSARCDEIGLTWSGDPVPLQQILAGIIHGAYREDLADWILEYKSHLLPVTHWLFAWGLDVLDYITHLANDGACDGLEIWLVSALSETPLNIIQEDTVLSTAKLGIDFAFSTIMLTSVGYGLLCEPD